MMLEVRSIANVTTINILVISLAFFLQWLRERAPSLRDWSLAFFIGAVGSALTGQRGQIPDLLAVAAGGSLLALIYVFTYTGLCRHFGQPVRRAIWLYPVAVLALFVYFIEIDYLPMAWPIITGYARVAICTVIFAQLWRRRAEMSAYASLMMLAAMFTMGLFMLVRGTTAFWMPDSGNFSSSSMPALTYFITAACTIAMTFGLLSLHVDRLLRQLAAAANTDELTGLHNRRCFNERAQIEIDRNLRARQPLWCLMLDIDHFKTINDNYGHAAGDQVLVEAGRIFRAALRSYDLVARYGGEEFCVMLPNTDAAAARRIAERLREQFAALRAGQQGAHHVTISIGAASHEGDGLDPLVSRADHALYEAKRGGRNRVVGLEDAADPAPVPSVD